MTHDVVVLGGPEVGSVVSLEKRIVIGRRAENDVDLVIFEPVHHQVASP